ncbi:MAG: hypothetical protein P8Y70_04435 [Candidatus Lokiarchaeota archaeon]
MNNENLDFYNFNCIKCGTERTKEFFVFRETKSYMKYRATTVITKKIKIPVCRDCRIEFEKWVDKHGTSKSAVRDSLCVPCCAIIISFFTFIIAFENFVMPYSVPLLSYILLGVGSLAILALGGGAYNTYRKVKSMQEVGCPHRYIKFEGGNTYVKPRGIGNWINYDLWLKNTTKIDENKVFETQLKSLQRNLELEEDINVIYCPECGERYNRGKNFCINCGKDLRTI